jgi:ectoine hydroxylase-related dioxygenase (phytanoyl-CoA dioxygenase family)
MGSVMVALDRANRENGCLQVLRGSHRVGRVDHGVLPGEQVGANLRRVEEMKKQLELVYVELEPGDALFFHANVMHRSDQNRSPNRRWTVLFCYNAARNNPYLEHHHPQYTPLNKVDDDAVRKAGARLSPEGVAHFRQSSANPPELTRRL